MSVGIEEWHAGIAKRALIFSSKAYKPIAFIHLLLLSLHACVYLYLFMLVALISIPASLLLSSSCLLLANGLEVFSVDVLYPASLSDPFALFFKAVSCIPFPIHSVF